MPIRNFIGTDGLDFLEFTSSEPEKLIAQFESMGFRAVAIHQTDPIKIYQQNDIRFIINLSKNSQASEYARFHGTSICSMGFKVSDATTALQYVRLKGATPYQPLDEKIIYDMPAIYGVGNMLIYFVEYKNNVSSYAPQFIQNTNTFNASQKLVSLDHIIFNLYRSHMVKWSDYFSRLFNFYETPHSTNEMKPSGYKSKSLISACGKIRIKLCESSNDKSNIESFLEHFKGEGIRRIEFATNSASIKSPPFLDTMDQIKDASVMA